MGSNNFLYRRIITAGVAVFFLAIAGIFTIRPSHQQNQSLPTVHADSQQEFKKTANTTLSCQDYETLYGANYYHQLYIGWTMLSRLVDVVPGQGQSFLNYQYNATANAAYSLYTGSLDRQTCTPAISAPNALSPSTPPANNFSPTGLSSTITTNCDVPLAAQYVGIYNQQYIRNIISEQAHIEQWVASQPSFPGGLTPALQQGAASIQSQLYTNTQNLIQMFNTDTGSVGC